MAQIKQVQFLAIIDEGNAALKISGAENGGKLVLAFDDSQVPQAMKAVVMRKQLLKVTIEPADED